MEKQYSVEFFMNFVENIQNLCHNFLEFNQNVEVSGYVCVDIDNMKKERYVLSEIVQMGGNSISESYCTKVFKTTPTGTVQRSGFRDITNARVPSAATSSGEVNVPGHSYSSQRMRTGHQRKSETSHTLSLNMAVSPRSQTKTAIDQSYSVFQGHNASSNSNSSFVNPSVTGIQGRESGPGDSQNRTKSRQLTPKVCRPATVPDSSVLKRRCEPSPLSDSADDADVIVVKQEPCDEEREEHGDQPPVKRRSETFRLPSSLTGGALPVIQHPHPAPSSSNTRGEDKSYFSSSSKETSNSTHHKDKKPDLSVEEIQNLEDYEVELVPSDAEEESLDLTFQVAHPGGAVQSSVIGAQDPGTDAVVLPGRPGIYTQQQAQALQLIELTPGSNVYVSHVQMTIAERKVKVEVRYGQPFRNACPSARYLLGLFYTRQELANSSLSDTQYSKFRGLDKTVIDAITGFCLSRSECPKAEIRGVLTRSITSARCQLKQKLIASLKKDSSVEAAWTF
ncbi:uncharacterized protein LOC124111699 isoform X2 [Haliotis rufescens]|uniref:uncharacterized protein LOC124111699 isoform X2 n=1 Tax=Haliotis rufescens TaxID=6454 RepID=UPI00201F97B2|nr:uncharacterized protein LOC124111699 isoform X2 [Haliotis rufescens]XP_046327427.2 uncharacterized protein LOC124111699 isoform X2 [Haliotis rufescens]XP_046327428.2 uncharacterized protein LOC124111699 isoform X2 [Haliotis rufescens]